MIQDAVNASVERGHDVIENIRPPTAEESAAMQQALVAPQIDPVEEAAMKFTKLLPYVKMLGQAMPSQKGLTRVLHAFAEFPLGKEKPRLLNEGERQLFHVMQELQGYKSTVIQAILQKNMEVEKLKQTATEMPVAEQEQTNVGN
jgi:hypothetical protein